MKSLLSVTPDTKAEEKEVSGETLAIRGGRPLTGRVEVKGAKNLATKAMVAALLGDTTSVLRDVPGISDVQVVRSLLEVHGVGVEDGDEPGTLIFDPSGAVSAHFEEIDAHAGASRIPILFCGPLLHLLGEALIPDLGGCRIGDRPINFHMDALRAFGAIVDKTYEGIRITAPNGLHGANIELPYPSVGATEQVLLAAVTAEGVTELSNAAIEPEIIDLIALLQKMGAIIWVAPDRILRIAGVPRLRGFTHTAMPDRLEVASWACAAIATGGEITVRNAHQHDMMTFLNMYRRVGGEFHIDDEGIRFWRASDRLHSIPLETDVHPGFMTDWQSPFVVALTQAEGISIIHETVYEDRFGYVSALNEMGAQLQLYRECLGGMPCRFGQRNYLHSAVVAGPKPLQAADVAIPDLRGGFSYVIAALVAQGTSTLRNMGIIRRGYEDFVSKLQSVGAKVRA
jgi:UDP-N-acetylglucosamine 1-carboxyvinyltransferase